MTPGPTGCIALSRAGAPNLPPCCPACHQPWYAGPPTLRPVEYAGKTYEVCCGVYSQHLDNEAMPATPSAPAAALRDSLSPMAHRNRHRSEGRANG